MIHTAVIYVWTVFDTLVMGLLAILTSFFDRSGNAVHRVARAWAQAILFISGVTVKVTGLERIDPNRSYIYMSNHQSNFDIPVLLGRFPVQFRWLAKAELFKIPIFGRAMRGAGYISIDRANRVSAIESLNTAAQTIRNGASVMIFPEGTRSRSGQIQPFKKGGFVLAVDAQVPIVPILIRGTYPIMPKGSFLIRPQAVSIDVLEPVETAAYRRKDKDALMARIHQAMTDHWHRQTDEKQSC
jgi:1-acyl-sn-glycerol-3-phosphate acyltransferase